MIRAFPSLARQQNFAFSRVSLARPSRMISRSALAHRDDAIKGHMQTAKENIQQGAQTVKETMQQGAEKAKETRNAGTAHARDAASTMADKASSEVQQGEYKTSEGARNVVDSAKDTVDSLKSAAAPESSVSKLYNDAVESSRQKDETLRDQAKSAVKDVGGKVKDAAGLK